MPPLPLTALLQTALPRMSLASRAVISALGCLNGKPPYAAEIAAWVGLRDRFQLARALRRDGLPPLEQLAGWARVLYWVLTAEATGTTLRQLARGDDMDPAVAYRLVNRLTGQHWSEVRRTGLPGLLPRFHEHCRIHAPSPPTDLVDTGMTPLGLLPATAYGQHLPVAPLRPAHHPRGFLVERHPFSGWPFDIAVTGGGTAFVTRTRSSTVDAFRIEPFQWIGSVPTSPTPTCVTIGARGAHAYVTNQFADEVGIISISGLRQTGAIPVMGNPLGITRSPDGRALYVTTNHDRLCAISVASAKVIGSVPLPLTGVHITTDPTGRRVYVPCWRAGVIVEIEAQTLKPLRQFEVGGTAQDVAISSDGRRMYVVNENGWLNVIHLGSGLIRTIPIDGAPCSLSLTPDDAVLYIGLVFEGCVLTMDAHSLQITGRLETGGKPRRIAFAPSGKTAVIANELGWIDVVH